GGTMGMAVIREANTLGVLRLVAIVIIGAFLVSPRATIAFFGAVALVLRVVIRGVWSLARGLWWLVTQAAQIARRLFAARRTPAPVQPQEAEGETSRQVGTPPPAKPEPRPTDIPPVQTTRTAPRPDLERTTREVWKKYTEAQPRGDVAGWQLPSLDILDQIPETQVGESENVRRARIIEEALASYGVEGKIVQINAGPTVTQFGVEPGWDRKYKEVKERDRDGNVRIKQEEISRTRVKVERITTLSNDLALALAAPSIRIEAPVPGKSIVGIEVPNTTFGVVSLRGVIESTPFQKLKARSSLALGLGKGAGGEAVAADLTRMPHLLIAGATNSGKTVCLNAVISCLLLYNTPDDLRFIMIDPKRVELVNYNAIPHLVTPVIVDSDRAVKALRWLLQEMDGRYQKFAAAGARNIDGYNKSQPPDKKIPFLVLVIDELADLIMVSFEEVERNLCRLAQMARATGIHLVVATQRPSVDVVTGLIKANFPTRISFAVSSQVDSRTILDSVGAEKLLGKGDMLYMPTDASKPKRLQGCFVSDPEIERLVYFWGSQQKAGAPAANLEEAMSAAVAKGAADEDPMMEEVRSLAREHKHLSTSFVQRRLRVGYPRAARLMELLEAERGAGQQGNKTDKT
ncbi:MAG: DNA translocase FtsK, partial [Dehalococcoidia bacterium]|nr:DNA translocase FtsK [Dehalococcoidia bacterium]